MTVERVELVAGHRDCAGRRCDLLHDDPGFDEARHLALQVLGGLLQAADRRPQLVLRSDHSGHGDFVAAIARQERFLVAPEFVDRAVDLLFRPVEGAGARHVRLAGHAVVAIEMIDHRGVELTLA